MYTLFSFGPERLRNPTPMPGWSPDFELFTWRRWAGGQKRWFQSFNPLGVQSNKCLILVCIYICMYICICIYMYIYIWCIHIHILMHIYKDIRIWTYLYIVWLYFYVYHIILPPPISLNTANAPNNDETNWPSPTGWNFWCKVTMAISILLQCSRTIKNQWFSYVFISTANHVLFG